MLKHSLTVSHLKQSQQADCLAACAAMVLKYYDLSHPYQRLLSLLEIKPFGAPAPNVQRLTRLGVSVTYEASSLEELEKQITLNHPCIVFLDTGELPYWSEKTSHAVVVVDMDDHYVYVNDPAFDKAPQSISWGDFDLAWLERGYYYAVVTPS